MKLVNVPLYLSNIIKLQSKTAFGSNIFKEMHVMYASTSDKEDRFESWHEDLIQVLGRMWTKWSCQVSITNTKTRKKEEQEKDKEEVEEAMKVNHLYYWEDYG